MTRSSSLLLLVLHLFSFYAHSVLPEQVDIAVYRIEGVLEADKEQLAYVKILSLLDKRIPIKLNYQFVHSLRAVETFNKNNIACLFPGSILAYDSDKHLIESTAVQVAKAYFIAKHEINNSQIIDPSYPALRIGYRRGNTYGGQIRTLAHHRLIPLNSGADIRHLLERDRIDVFLGYIPDSLSVVNAIPERPLAYSETSLFYQQNDSFLCHDTPDNQILVELINLEIQKMYESGELQTILATLY